MEGEAGMDALRRELASREAEVNALRRSPSLANSGTTPRGLPTPRGSMATPRGY